MTLPKGHKECKKCGKVFPYEHSYIKNCQSCRNAKPTNLRHHLPDLMSDQKGVCPLCNKLLPPEISAEVHVDHIVPKHHGGTDDYSNLQATHCDCNKAKNVSMP